MAKSLFNVVLQNGTYYNVLAQPDTSGKSALQAAIEKAQSIAPEVGLQNAIELQGRPIDYAIDAAVAPVTDGAPKTVYQVQFRAGSGNGGVNVAPVMVLSNPQTNGGVVTSAADLAIAKAAAMGGATPNSAACVGNVDLDATV